MLSRIDRSWYTRPPQVPEEVSAGGIIFRFEGQQTFIALIQEMSCSSAYVLPKGHQEPGESLEQTARREIHEETGLTHLKQLANLGSRERLSFCKTAWKITHYFLFSTEQVDGIPTDLHKAYKLQWFSIDCLPELFWPEQQKLIEENCDRILALAKQPTHE